MVTSPPRPISLADGELIMTSFLVVGSARARFGKTERLDDWSQDNWPWLMRGVDRWRAVTTNCDVTCTLMLLCVCVWGGGVPVCAFLTKWHKNTGAIQLCASRQFVPVRRFKFCRLVQKYTGHTFLYQSAGFLRSSDTKMHGPYIFVRVRRFSTD